MKALAATALGDGGRAGWTPDRVERCRGTGAARVWRGSGQLQDVARDREHSRFIRHFESRICLTIGLLSSFQHLRRAFM